MSHESTIGERLGAPKYGYIEPKNREDAPRASRDGEAMRSAILAYIKEHEGEFITNMAIAAVVGTHNTNIMHHVKILEKTGRITIIRESPLKRRWYIGRRPKAGDRGNGPVETVKPAAPLSRSAVRNLDAEAWAYIKTIKDQDAQALGYMVKGVVGLVDILNTKLVIDLKGTDGKTDLAQDDAPRGGDAEHTPTPEADRELRGGSDDVPADAGAVQDESSAS